MLALMMDVKDLRIVISLRFTIFFSLAFVNTTRGKNFCY